jgi:hypothetical protein
MCKIKKSQEFATVSQRKPSLLCKTAVLTILVPQTLEKLELLLSMRAEEKIICQCMQAFWNSCCVGLTLAFLCRRNLTFWTWSHQTRSQSPRAEHRQAIKRA